MNLLPHLQMTESDVWSCLFITYEKGGRGRGWRGAAKKTRGNAIDCVSVRSNAFDPTHSLINSKRPLSLI